EGEILVGQRQDRQLCEIDLLLARQRQEQVDRPLEPVEIEDQRRLGCPLCRIGAGQPDCPVTCSTNWISASAGTPTKRPSRLKPRPMRTPTYETTNSSIKINIP